jgi:sugar phosphate isomerase/epimerase
MVEAAGIRGFELVPADYQGTIGYPYTARNVGLWPRAFGKEARGELHDKLRAFAFVTVHSPNLGVNIASINPGIREESVRQYLEIMELAVDIGAEIVTWHCGKPTDGFVSPANDIIARDLDFGRRALDYARMHHLRIGYEVTAPFARLSRVLDELGPEFGLNLDIGHAAMGDLPPEGWIDRYGDRIIEVHFNSVFQLWDPGVFVEHQPMERNNVINYPAVFSRLKKGNYQGPIVLELLGNDISQALDVCLRAMDGIMRLWAEV